MATSMYLRGGRRTGAPSVNEVIPETATAALSADALQQFLFQQTQAPQQRQQQGPSPQQQAALSASRMSQQQYMQQKQQQQLQYQSQQQAAMERYQQMMARRENDPMQDMNRDGTNSNKGTAPNNTGPVNKNVARALQAAIGMGLTSMGPIGMGVGMLGQNLTNDGPTTMGNIAQTGANSLLGSFLGTDVNTVRGILGMLGIGPDPVKAVTSPINKAVKAFLTPEKEAAAANAAGGGNGSSGQASSGYVSPDMYGDPNALGTSLTGDYSATLNDPDQAQLDSVRSFESTFGSGGRGGRESGGFGGTNNSAGGGRNTGFNGGSLA